MTRALGWLGVLVGCAGPTVDQGTPDTGQGSGLVVAVGAEQDDEDLERVRVHLTELVLEGTGPEGEVSVSVSTDETAELVGDAADETSTFLFLPRGAYDDVRVTAWLRESTGMAALEAGGQVDEFDVDLVVVPSLPLRSERVSFDLDGRPGTLELTLRPGQWFDGVDLEELADGEERVSIGPGSGEIYDDVLERITDSLRTDWRGDEGEDDP